MNRLILTAVLFLSLIFTNSIYTQNYFYYHFGQKLEMNRNYAYLTVKFRQNTPESEINRVYNTVQPLVKHRMDFTARSAHGNVLIMELKEIPLSGVLADLENTLKTNASVSETGMCFTYNDKVLHFSTDEVIVKFKSKTTLFDIQNLNRIFKANIIQRVPEFENTYLVSIDPASTDNVFDLANKFVLTDFVELAQPNFIRTGMLLDANSIDNAGKNHREDRHGNNNLKSSFIPNDTLNPHMWNLKNTGTNIPDNVPGIPGSDMNMEPAWTVATGNPNVLLAIIDTGIDTNHTDLRDNLCDRILWYDAYDNDQKPYDEYYHGTGVSGTAIAVGNNIQGMAGIAYNCRVMPVRVFGPYPAGFTTDLILAKGLNWSWTHGAAVLNNSWGGGIPGSLITLAIQNAVNYGRNSKGSVVFGGAGNADTNIVIYPASMDEVIGVGGLSPCFERKSRVSCDIVGGPNQDWGACYGEGMEIVAPCTYIGTTTLLGGWCICGNGTSVSSPLAAGVAALMISKNVNISGDSVKMIIEVTARKVGNYSYNIQKENGMWNNEMGYGTIDAKACLDMTPPGPSDIYDQVPPLLTIYPPESAVFSTSIIVEAVITDNIGVGIGVNSPRMYYRTLQTNQLQVIYGYLSGENRYRFTFPVIPVSEGFYYYLAAQDNVPVPNFVTYPLGGSGVNPPGKNPPAKFMFVRNTDKYDTALVSLNVPIPITAERETSFVSILSNPVSKTVLDVDVLLNAEHTFDADLTFSLISPSGTEVVLAGGVGLDGNNFTGTFFDDEAAIRIDSSLALPPFTGRFKPIDKLWLFDGENSYGTWKLRVIDNGFQDGGALLGWSLYFKYSTGSDYVNIPGSFSLVKNYPNPFNPRTRILFNVPRTAKIKITVYDITGKEVKTILNETRQPALEDFIDFDASNLATGVYFYSMIADDEFIESKKMVLVK